MTSSVPTEPVLTPLSDYAKLYTTWAEHAVAHPRSVADVQDVVRRARAEGRAVRVRGSAHTFSGATLPRRGEVLLRTKALDRFRFETPGTLTAGAGALAWDVRDFVSLHGLHMPVYNGGWAGPTLGGYLSAGGMGLRVPPAERERWLAAAAADDAPPPLQSISETHGGFWEHVAAVTLVDGTGAVREFSAGDEEFPWLFASFGQLGVVVELTLKLLPAPGKAVPYPTGLSGRVPRVQADDPAVNDPPPGPLGERVLFWFSYLVSAAQEEEAWDAIGRWVRAHADFLRPQGGWVGPTVFGEPIGYRYLVRFRSFNPPLLYPRAEDFVLLGLMATFTGVGTLATDDRILVLERDFVHIAHRHGFRLYPQAENIGRGLDYASYYDDRTFGAFARLKARFDPDGIINPGVVFPASIDAPPRSAHGRLSEATLGRLLESLEPPAPREGD